MTLRAAGKATVAGLTPTSYTPTTSDTISGDDIIPNLGVALRVVTTGTAATLTVVDPFKTAGGSVAASQTVSLPGTGTRYVFIPSSVVDPTTNLATVTLSVITGISCELVQF